MPCLLTSETENRLWTTKMCSDLYPGLKFTEIIPISPLKEFPANKFQCPTPKSSNMVNLALPLHLSGWKIIFFGVVGMTYAQLLKETAQ